MKAGSNGKQLNQLEQQGLTHAGFMRTGF
jgi:hypothetical protein